MKKYLIIIVLLAITFTSCDGQLETFPSDAIAADVAFTNEGDFTNALRGMYLGMLDDINGQYYGGPLQAYDVMTDNLIISEEGRKSQQATHDWTYDSNSAFVNNFMEQGYEVVQDANFVLANTDVLESGAFKNNVMGEALAGRALAHFDLVRYYAKIPTQSSDAGASLALPYVTIADPSDIPARITVTEYYANLVSDLTTAAGLINTSNGNTQMGKDAVNGILARVYLHMGEWQNAVNAANNVSASVASRSTFTGVWDDSNDDGVIFKLQNDNVTRVTLGVPYNQTANGIKSEYVPDFEFFAKYTGNDIRKSAYFETSLFDGLNYNHVIKWYSSISTTSLGVVDAKVLRAAEVMLIKAEALAELGQDGPALTALNAVKSQRFSGFVSGNQTGQDLKDAIALERRLELAFEGTRFSDIKRKGMAVQRSSFGHFADGSGIPATFQTLPVGDYHFQLPISINELNLNPNMVQNPGYGN